MYSSFYTYAHIKTSSISKVFSTKLVEDFLTQQNGIITKGNGAFSSHERDFQVQIMKVEDFDSWNSNNYHSTEANLIDFIITRDRMNNYSYLITQLTALLQLPFQVEDD